MRYYQAKKSLGSIPSGALITEREAARDKRRRRLIESECVLVRIPAKETQFVSGVRYAKPSAVPVSIAS